MSGRNTGIQGVTRLTDIPIADVEIWHLDLDAIRTHLERVKHHLSSDEQERANHFIQRKTNEQFVLVRGLLREILAERINSTASESVTPSSLHFSYGCFGKPFLSEYQDWQFNVAHTRNIALIAVIRNRAVGIDVQWCNPDMNINEAMIAAYSDSEKLLADLDPKAKHATGFQLWTLKEAYAKANGRGLSLKLKNINVSASIDRPAFILDKGREHRGYELQSLNSAHLSFYHCKAAIAVERDY
jgi:4'-phosphopantetheinyl transferase